MLGATGPVDAAKRRPWIDWIHTARDQGAIVRGYIKWDDQPASPAAAREALLRAALDRQHRAAWARSTSISTPGCRRRSCPTPLPPIDAARFSPPLSSGAAPSLIARGRRRCCAARKRPVILAGRVSRSLEAWDARVALAEALGARVVTDLKVGAAFPTDHPLHAGAPGVCRSTPEAATRLPRPT